MKARLEFTLPEEDVEFKQAMKAGDVFAVLHEYDNELREIIKYETRADLHAETVEKLRTLFNEVLDRWDVRQD